MASHLLLLNPNPTMLGITLLKTILISSNGELMMEMMVQILEERELQELQVLQAPMEQLVEIDLKAEVTLTLLELLLAMIVCGDLMQEVTMVRPLDPIKGSQNAITTGAVVVVPLQVTLVVPGETAIHEAMVLERIQ